MEHRSVLDVQDGLTITRIGFLELTGRWKSTLHAHKDDWEVIVPLSGRLWQAGSETMKEVADHPLYLIPPGIMHGFVNADDSPASMFYVYFNFSYAPLIEQLEDIQEYIDHIPEMAILHRQFEQIVDEMGVITQETLNQKRGDVLQAMSMLVLYLYMYSDPNYKSISHQNSLIGNVKMYLQENVDRKVTVTEVAQRFFLTPNYLGLLFHEQEHISIKQYHEQLRMARALDMLRSNTQISVTQIAETLGYGTAQYFTRRFKQYYLVSPSQILERAREEREREKED